MDGGFLLNTLGSLDERSKTTGVTVDRVLVISAGTSEVGLIPESNILTSGDIQTLVLRQVNSGDVSSESELISGEVATSEEDGSTDNVASTSSVGNGVGSRGRSGSRGQVELTVV